MYVGEYKMNKVHHTDIVKRKIGLTGEARFS